MLLVWLLAALQGPVVAAAARPHELPRRRRRATGSADHSAAMREIRSWPLPEIEAAAAGLRRQEPEAPRGPRSPGGHRLPHGRSGRPPARRGRIAVAAGHAAPARRRRTSRISVAAPRLVTRGGGQAAAARPRDRGANRPSGLRHGAGGGLPLARVPGHGLLLRRGSAAPRPSGRRGPSDAGLRGRDPRPGARPRAPGFGGRAPARRGGTCPERRPGPRPGTAGSTASLGQLLVDRGRLVRGGVAPRPGRGSRGRRSPALPGAALPRPPRRRPRPRRRRGRLLPPRPRGLARQPGRATGSGPGPRAVLRALRRLAARRRQPRRVRPARPDAGPVVGLSASARRAMAQASLSTTLDEVLGR